MRRLANYLVNSLVVGTCVGLAACTGATEPDVPVLETTASGLTEAISPTVVLTSPTQMQEFGAGSEIEATITVAGADLAGGSHVLVWFLNGDPVAQLDAATPFTFGPLDPGLYQIAARLLDANEDILPNATSLTTVYIRVTAECEEDLQCSDALSCSDDACLGGECRYGQVTGCCDHDLDCPYDWFCHDNTCRQCFDDGECDDGNACTTDYCGADGICGHMPIDNCCEADADCVSDSKCEVGSCGAGNQCVFSISEDANCCDVDSDCPVDDPCTQRLCYKKPSKGLSYCRYGPKLPGCCVGDGDCTDGDACSVDTCVDIDSETGAGHCDHPTVTGVACCTSKWDCEDEDPSTKDTCVDNVCDHAPDPNWCDFPETSPIVITEMMIAPKGIDDAWGEWFEIYNTTDERVTVHGWTIERVGPGGAQYMHLIDDTHSIGSIYGASVAPGEHFVFGRSANKNLNGGYLPHYAYLNDIGLPDVLEQGGGQVKWTLRLRDTEGMIVDSVTYDSETFPFEDGRSLELAHYHADNDDPQWWSVSGHSGWFPDNRRYGKFPDKLYASPRKLNKSSLRGLPDDSCPLTGNAGACASPVCNMDNQCAVEAADECCLSDLDCADDDACTANTCNLVTHQCEVIQYEGCCTHDSQCNDYNKCNLDRCLGGECRYSPDIIPECENDDNDGDGSPNDEDCEPDDPTIYPGADDSFCDGIDNDCDGLLDDDHTPTPSTCGTGACAAGGLLVCELGQIVDTCAPKKGQSDDATCDGIDDDCDGAVDEDFVAAVVACGVGACASTGTTQCIDGDVVQKCTGGNASDDDDCDGVDDDCDGLTDEHFADKLVACGEGACKAFGTLSCVDGVETNQCSAGDPTGDDTDCDGVDDDCDGHTDEHFAVVNTSCGEGACAGTGTLSCVDGAEVDSCSAGQAGASDDDCNGIDDDCDGEIDEGYTTTSTTCGVGACAASGTRSCVNGTEVDTCSAGSPGGSDADCNGIDDDCDGQIDEGYVVTSTNCGSGACTATGTLSCINGTEVDSCSAGEGGAQDNDCDGVDDDCDGQIDEGYVATSTTCGVGACAATGTLSCVNGAEVDNCTAGSATGDDNDCNGVDDDCDGQVDEGFQASATSCGVGACAATGTLTCVNGAPVDSCTASNGSGQDSDCDGVDDDCDGQIDEHYTASNTTCGQGACAATGTLTCVNGAEVDSCSVASASGDDTDCDGVDDDCDGQIDEHYVASNTSCGVGACAAAGTLSCVGGVEVDSCSAGNTTGDDSDCDGVDDDCDGQRDEHYASVNTSCGTGNCAATGSTSCLNGSVADSCSAGSPGVEVCNDADDDCDGAIDEDGICEVGQPCDGPDPDVCLDQTKGPGGTCTGGAVFGWDFEEGSGNTTADVTGNSHAGTVAALWDVSHDGGGAVFLQGVAGSTVTASLPNSTGGFTFAAWARRAALVESTLFTRDASGGGRLRIVADGSLTFGQGSYDTGANLPFDAQWHHVAYTFDGVTMTGYVDGVAKGSVTITEPPELGSGFYLGQNATCLGGCFSNAGAFFGHMDEVVWYDGALEADDIVDLKDHGIPGIDRNLEACDGVDNDCDGQIDEGCPTCTPTAATDVTCDGQDDDCDGQIDEDFVVVNTSCGVGACAAAGTLTCVNGSAVDSCSAGPATGDDTDCDGVDDDCDGSADEHYTPSSTSCGVGACSATGTLSCVNGAEVDSCTAGAPGQDDDCDGVDDDCDGARDEHYEQSNTTCGVGACASTGTLSCIGGAEVDSCLAGSTTGADNDCDGIDDDCDGQADEHFITTATTCGVGGCAATGTLSCVDGHIADSCSAGSPSTDDDCDGVDDDCDGSTDEHYTASGTTCGVGACAASGTLTCINGSEVNSCSPGAGSSDNDCDGVDDDCDGSTDEHYVTTVSSCGLGACASTGTLSCANGIEVDSCSAGSASGADNDCDGVDDDCDGLTDEHYVSTATSCGKGVCASTGTLSCVDGSVVNSCSAGSPTGNDTDCDNKDDDCDGLVDEHYVNSQTSCGTGACKAFGTLSCSAGNLVNSCSAGSPTGNDTDCDGVDDDCDGLVDESWVDLNTSCGIGECSASGKLICFNGSKVNTCSAGSPKADNQCDGKDNDCDGSKDEHYSVTATSCGVGACAKTGALLCSNGKLVNTCSAGTPATDNNCNNIDDDCDGLTDEHYPTSTTSCGTGACGSTGQLTCQAGSVVNTCKSGSPTSDNNCDGVDNDCDGQTDEGCVGVATGVKYDVAAGEKHSCGRTNSGVIKCWGKNNYGQVGPNAGSTAAAASYVTNGTKQVDAGLNHNCTVKNDGRIYCWGRGANGRLGYGGTSNKSTPVQAGSFSDYVQVTAGAAHSCGLRKNGTVYCWGKNNKGQLGTGNYSHKTTPTKVVGLPAAKQIDTLDYHTCAVTTTNKVYCWGDNDYGQLSHPSTNKRHTPYKVNAITNARYVAAGTNFTCVLRADERVVCFGRNHTWQLGSGGAGGESSSPVLVQGIQYAKSITAGGFHACIKDKANNAVCWGNGQYGQIGTGGSSFKTASSNANINSVQYIDAGYQHTCAKKSNGQVWCWGRGSDHRLGNGSTSQKVLPTRVTNFP